MISALLSDRGYGHNDNPSLDMCLSFAVRGPERSVACNHDQLSYPETVMCINAGKCISISIRYKAQRMHDPRQRLQRPRKSCSERAGQFNMYISTILHRDQLHVHACLNIHGHQFMHQSNKNSPFDLTPALQMMMDYTSWSLLPMYLLMRMCC